MDDIDFFDNVDLKEVSKKTLISIKDLESLKNDDFSRLGKSKGLGFIKILEREYKVDLTAKKERFLDYLKEYEKDSEKELFVTPPKPPTKIFSKLFALVLLVLIGVGILYIVYLNSRYSDKSNQAVSRDNEIVKEAQSIAGIDVNSTNDTKILEENNEINNTQMKVDSSKNSATEHQMILKEENITNTSETILQNELNDTMKDSRNIMSVAGENNQTTSVKQISNLALDTLTIEPKNRIWVGVIDLKNHKRKSYLKDGNITIQNSNAYIIATGHGKFKLYYKSKVLDFNSKYPIRLLVQDGNVTKIDKKEFIKLNRGKYW